MKTSIILSVNSSKEDLEVRMGKTLTIISQKNNDKITLTAAEVDVLIELLTKTKELLTEKTKIIE